MSPEAERGARRLFFALWPSDGVRARLAEWSRELHTVCGGRAMQAQDLHLTLAFLGSVPQARLGEIKRAAGKVVMHPATLVLDRPGFWKHNRIAWAGASSVPAELDALVLELRDALTQSGIPFDAKPFAAHVTLLRDAREPRVVPVLAPIRWKLEDFVLAGSAARPGGARYDILRAWPAR